MQGRMYDRSANYARTGPLKTTPPPPPSVAAHTPGDSVSPWTTPAVVLIAPSEVACPVVPVAATSSAAGGRRPARSSRRRALTWPARAAGWASAGASAGASSCSAMEVSLRAGSVGAAAGSAAGGRWPDRSSRRRARALPARAACWASAGASSCPAVGISLRAVPTSEVSSAHGPPSSSGVMSESQRSDATCSRARVLRAG